MADATGSGGGVKLFVGQVPAICSEDQLSAIFGQFGDIDDIQIMRDKQTQRSKGSAWVTFQEASAAEDAIATLHGKHSIPPQSNPLQIRYAGKQGQQRPPSQQPPPPAAPPGMLPGGEPHPYHLAPGMPPGPPTGAPLGGMMGGWDAPGGGGQPPGVESPPNSPPGIPPSAGAAPWQNSMPPHPMVPGGGAMIKAEGMSPRGQRGRGGGGRGTDRGRHPNRGGRKLFVGQLPKTMSQPEVQALLAPFGEIEELHVMQDRKTGQGTGAAFCIFTSRDMALAAIDALNGKHTCDGMGQPMQVRLAEGEQSRDEEAKLFVGQVPYAATEEDVRQLFGQFGQLTEVALVRKGGHSKGCGFVRYANRHGAESAIASLNGQHVMQGSHSPLTVRFADSEQEKRKRRETRNQQQVNQLSGMMGRMHMNPNGMPMPMQAPFNPGMAMGQMPMQMPMGQMGQMGMMPMMGYGPYPGMPMVPVPGSEQ